MAQRPRFGRLDDEQLLNRMRSGRVDALEELYRRYGERAYRVAISVCRDDRRARDVIHHTFVTVWRDRASDQSPPGSVAAWLLISVYQRAQGQAAELREDPLTGLPEDLREVIVLAHYGQLSHSEIAASLGVGTGTGTGTVKDRMRLGLHQLQATSA
jgi:DNA-directed RNA polymerase specialized sigma24 family protein